MYLHPHVASQLAGERHREMLAQAERHRLARQFAVAAKASRRAERRMRQGARRALRLRTELEQ